ncbi:hypothetical protein GMRT_10117 [Giardia muris]|uniref:Uncharacterized protein n=1 Tax=Giardia muris TaxID=5742 RepID=A0A4Z1T3Z6_GIAMU|nr:hypothetical protein GMRT_10117 [Giardia muris]|eukprot:TNJ27767.1 hypothetical protein GMRT_10117 [Giardia muris]
MNGLIRSQRSYINTDHSLLHLSSISTHDSEDAQRLNGWDTREEVTGVSFYGDAVSILTSCSNVYELAGLGSGYLARPVHAIEDSPLRVFQAVSFGKQATNFVLTRSNKMLLLTERYEPFRSFQLEGRMAIQNCVCTSEYVLLSFAGGYLGVVDQRSIQKPSTSLTRRDFVMFGCISYVQLAKRLRAEQRDHNQYYLFRETVRLLSVSARHDTPYFLQRGVHIALIMPNGALLILSLRPQEETAIDLVSYTIALPFVRKPGPADSCRVKYLATSRISCVTKVTRHSLIVGYDNSVVQSFIWNQDGSMSPVDGISMSAGRVVLIHPGIVELTSQAAKKLGASVDTAVTSTSSPSRGGYHRFLGALVGTIGASVLELIQLSPRMVILCEVSTPQRFISQGFAFGMSNSETSSNVVYTDRHGTLLNALLPHAIRFSNLPDDDEIVSTFVQYNFTPPISYLQLRDSIQASQSLVMQRSFLLSTLNRSHLSLDDLRVGGGEGNENPSSSSSSGIKTNSTKLETNGQTRYITPSPLAMVDFGDEGSVSMSASISTLPVPSSEISVPVREPDDLVISADSVPCRSEDARSSPFQYAIPVNLKDDFVEPRLCRMMAIARRARRRQITKGERISYDDTCMANVQVRQYARYTLLDIAKHNGWILPEELADSLSSQSFGRFLKTARNKHRTLQTIYSNDIFKESLRAPADGGPPGPENSPVSRTTVRRLLNAHKDVDRIYRKTRQTPNRDLLLSKTAAQKLTLPSVGSTVVHRAPAWRAIRTKYTQALLQKGDQSRRSSGPSILNTGPRRSRSKSPFGIDPIRRQTDGTTLVGFLTKSEDTLFPGLTTQSISPAQIRSSKYERRSYVKRGSQASVHLDQGILNDLRTFTKINMSRMFGATAEELMDLMETAVQKLPPAKIVPKLLQIVDNPTVDPELAITLACHAVEEMSGLQRPSTTRKTVGQEVSPSPSTSSSEFMVIGDIPWTQVQKDETFEVKTPLLGPEFDTDSDKRDDDEQLQPPPETFVSLETTEEGERVFEAIDEILASAQHPTSSSSGDLVYALSGVDNESVEEELIVSRRSISDPSNSRLSLNDLLPDTPEVEDCMENEKIEDPQDFNVSPEQSQFAQSTPDAPHFDDTSISILESAHETSSDTILIQYDTTFGTSNYVPEDDLNVPLPVVDMVPEPIVTPVDVDGKKDVEDVDSIPSEAPLADPMEPDTDVDAGSHPLPDASVEERLDTPEPIPLTPRDPLTTGLPLVPKTMQPIDDCAPLLRKRGLRRKDRQGGTSRFAALGSYLRDLSCFLPTQYHGRSIIDHCNDEVDPTRAPLRHRRSSSLDVAMTTICISGRNNHSNEEATEICTAMSVPTDSVPDDLVSFRSLFSVDRYEEWARLYRHNVLKDDTCYDNQLVGMSLDPLYPTSENMACEDLPSPVKRIIKEIAEEEVSFPMLLNPRARETITSAQLQNFTAGDNESAGLGGVEYPRVGRHALIQAASASSHHSAMPHDSTRVPPPPPSSLMVDSLPYWDAMSFTVTELAPMKPIRIPASNGSIDIEIGLYLPQKFLTRHEKFVDTERFCTILEPAFFRSTTEVAFTVTYKNGVAPSPPPPIPLREYLRSQDLAKEPDGPIRLWNYTSSKGGNVAGYDALIKEYLATHGNTYLTLPSPVIKQQVSLSLQSIAGAVAHIYTSYYTYLTPLQTSILKQAREASPSFREERLNHIPYSVLQPLLLFQSAFALMVHFRARRAAEYTVSGLEPPQGMQKMLEAIAKHCSPAYYSVHNELRPDSPALNKYILTVVFYMRICGLEGLLAEYVDFRTRMVTKYLSKGESDADPYRNVVDLFSRLEAYNRSSGGVTKVLRFSERYERSMAEYVASTARSGHHPSLAYFSSQYGEGGLIPRLIRPGEEILYGLRYFNARQLIVIRMDTDEGELPESHLARILSEYARACFASNARVHSYGVYWALRDAEEKERLKEGSGRFRYFSDIRLEVVSLSHLFQIRLLEECAELKIERIARFRLRSRLQVQLLHLFFTGSVSLRQLSSCAHLYVHLFRIPSCTSYRTYAEMVSRRMVKFLAALHGLVMAELQLRSNGMYVILEPMIAQVLGDDRATRLVDALSDTSIPVLARDGQSTLELPDALLPSPSERELQSQVQAPKPRRLTEHVALKQIEWLSSLGAVRETFSLRCAIRPPSAEPTPISLVEELDGVDDLPPPSDPRCDTAFADDIIRSDYHAAEENIRQRLRLLFDGSVEEASEPPTPPPPKSQGVELSEISLAVHGQNSPLSRRSGSCAAPSGPVSQLLDELRRGRTDIRPAKYRLADWPPISRTASTYASPLRGVPRSVPRQLPAIAAPRSSIILTQRAASGPVVDAPLY